MSDDAPVRQLCDGQWIAHTQLRVAVDRRCHTCGCVTCDESQPPIRQMLRCTIPGVPLGRADSEMAKLMHAKWTDVHDLVLGGCDALSEGVEQRTCSGPAAAGGGDDTCPEGHVIRRPDRSKDMSVRTCTEVSA